MNKTTTSQESKANTISNTINNEINNATSNATNNEINNEINNATSNTTNNIPNKKSKKLDIVMTIAWLLAIISALIIHPSAEYLSYIDFRSLGILWGLMVIIQGLKENSVFERIAQVLLSKVQEDWQLAAVLIAMCYVGSMLITNDVALITFVPFAIMILHNCNRDDIMIPVIVLQTIAANLGSMLTPIGNPQNLYMYGLTGMGLMEFILLMLPYSLIAAALLAASIFFIFKNPIVKNKKVAPKANAINEIINSAEVDINSSVITNISSNAGTANNSKIRTNINNNTTTNTTSSATTNTTSSTTANTSTNTKLELSYERQIVSYFGSRAQIIIYTILFVIALLTVMRFIPWYVFAAVVLIIVGGMDYKILFRADYILLLTFIGFFIFTGNMGRIDIINTFLGRVMSGREFIISVLTSQVISNVPATLMLSGYTTNYRALIIGVNLGGLGTLIASMASLISYKAYAKEYKNKSAKYIRMFTVYNIIFFIILSAAYTLMTL